MSNTKCYSFHFSYLSCSPAIISSAFCCPAVDSPIMLPVRSMLLFSGPQIKCTKLSSLLVMALSVYKIASETRVGEMLCIRKERVTQTWCISVRMTDRRPPVAFPLSVTYLVFSWETYPHGHCLKLNRNTSVFNRILHQRSVLIFAISKHLHYEVSIDACQRWVTVK